MAEYQLDVGQWVQWYRFNKNATTSHPVYDTGPERAWYPAITLPVYMAEYVRADQNFDDDGLHRVDRAHLIFSYFAFFQTTMQDPDPTGQDHVNDRVLFDGSLFSVDAFNPRGRVADQFLTVSVDLRQVAQSELDEDFLTSQFPTSTAVPDSLGPGDYRV
jgi:hypothetical protein